MNGERLELVREDEGECGSVRGSGEKQGGDCRPAAVVKFSTRGS